MQTVTDPWKPLFLVLLAGLVASCDNQPPDDKLQPVKAEEIKRIMPADEALAGADIAKVDPAPLLEAEIRKAIGEGARCEFRYTGSGKPVLAVGQTDAIVKLNGRLIALKMASPANDGSVTVAADPVRMAVQPEQEDGSAKGERIRSREATGIFEVGQQLKVGYRGHWDCGPAQLLRSVPH